MKRFFVILTILSCLSVEAAAVEKFSAGEWPKVSRQRKIYFVMEYMEEFQKRHQTVFRRTMEDYIGYLDKMAATHSKSDDMGALFSKAVYLNEKR